MVGAKVVEVYVYTCKCPRVYYRVKTEEQEPIIMAVVDE